MIRLNDPNIDFKEFKVIENEQRDEKIKERYFVPYCRVKEGMELFENKDYCVSELSDEIYACLHSKI